MRASNETGFKAVFKHRNVFKAKTYGGGAQYLGSFPTAEEAALAYARHIGSARAAAEATKWASKSLGNGRGRVLPSELMGGAPVLRLVETPVVVPVVMGMDKAGHGMVVVVATELFATEDGASTVDMDVVANSEVLVSQAQVGACGHVLDTAAAAAQVGACGHVLDTAAAAVQAHGVGHGHATPPSVSVGASGMLLVASAPAAPVAHASRPRPPPSVVARASVERAVDPLAVAEPIMSCQVASQAAYGAGHVDSNVRGNFKALTAPEVLAMAAEEGLCLVRCSIHETGFKSVIKL